MTLSEVITRIQQQCPGFAFVGHVLTGPAVYSLPAALVVPVRYTAVPPRINYAGAFSQDVAATIGVYLVLRRQENGPFDSGAADEFDALTSSLRTALVSWHPSSLTYPIIYAGGEMAPYDAGMFTWRDDFSARFEMRITT
jgi:hypothetical protein